jgi:Viral BACON domain/Cohesin domain
MCAGMKIIKERYRPGRRRVSVMLLLLMLALVPLSHCKKNPTSPDAALLERPIIWLNASEISFAASPSGPVPAPQELRIKNSGKNTLKYTISDDVSWLSVSPVDGSSTGQVNGHAVSVDASGLPAGDADYTATITVSCADAFNNPQKVGVVLKLTKEPPPQISVSPAALTFAGQAGGANPSAQTITIRNSGKSTLNYTISDDAGWLDVNPTSGSSSGESRSHSVTVNSSGLAEGSYTATITVTDPKAANSPQRVSVALQISKQAPPTIVVSRSSLSFSAQAGGGSPSPQTIGIRNGGTGTLTYAIAWDAAWLSVAPASGSSTGQENTHQVNVNSGGLSQGSYSGTITVTASGAANSPQVVAVSLQITAPAGSNQISVSCSPSQGVTGTTVSFPVSISGNSKAIAAFGLQLTFDTAMFQYVGTSAGGLTGGWTVGGNESSPGTVTIGGFAGGGSPVPAGSSGTIAIVTLKVTGGTYSDGKQSVVAIRSYGDDISGMKPEPATTTFTYRK